MRFCSACRRIYREDGDFCAADGQPLSVVDENNDPLRGLLFEGRYRLQRMLGHGGNGVVYAAEQVGLGRPVAFKMLYAERMKDPRALARFEREAKALAALDHPGCVRVLEYGKGPDVPFLVMDFVRGRALDALVEGDRSIPARHAVHVAAQVADAIGAAHDAGIVHRDLKPANIVLDVRDGTLFVRLLDFGLALLSSPSEGESRLTQQGLVFGTPEYMSPEQVKGTEADGRSDLYALGVVLYELTTGAPPFRADKPATVMVMQLESTPPPLELPEVAGEGVDALRRLIFRLLAKDPNARPESAGAVAAELRRIEALLPDAGPPSSILVAPERDPSGVETLETVGMEPAEVTAAPTAAKATRSRAPLIIVATLIVLGVGAAAAFAYDALRGPDSAAFLSFPERAGEAPLEEVELHAGAGREDPDGPRPLEELAERGTTILPGGESQESYETALRAVESRWSAMGLRARDLRSHPRGAQLWSEKSREARGGGYDRATLLLDELDTLAATMTAPEWARYRLRRVETSMNEDSAPAARARVTALRRTVDGVRSPSDVRLFMRRLDEVEAAARRR